MYDENNNEFKPMVPENNTSEPEPREEMEPEVNFIMMDSVEETVDSEQVHEEAQTGETEQEDLIWEEPVRKEPPRSSLFRKAAGITAAAMLFGVVSGSVMVGINWSVEEYKTANSIKISQAETLPVVDPGITATSTASSLGISLDVSSIVDNAMPSVVSISSTVVYQSQTWFGPVAQEGTGSGSGIIVGQNDDELLIVTNNHVVEGAKQLTVNFIDNSSVEAAIKGTDSESDLAVIAVPLNQISEETLSQISIATLGDSDSLKVGQGVVAIGNALGYGQSVTVGYVSALDREVITDDGIVRNLLQTDAAINPGNSGGALLNMKGEVVAINSAKYSSTEVEGIGYAIPISKAQDIINELMTKKTRNQVSEEKQGYLGIQGKNIDQTTASELGMPTGIFVYKIVEGGAAADSDLREKDIITKFDGQSVKSMEDLKNMLSYYEGGDTITLTVQSLEGGQYVERSIDVKLGTKPAEQIVN